MKGRADGISKVFKERAESGNGRTYLAMQLPFLVEDIQALTRESITEDPPARWWQFWSTTSKPMAR